MTPDEQRTLLGHVQAMSRALDGLLVALEGVETVPVVVVEPPSLPLPPIRDAVTTDTDPVDESPTLPVVVLPTYGLDPYGHGPYGGAHA